VDPIDGTRSFIAGRPEFTLSLGLVEDGEPVVGVVYNPARDEMYYATRGAGAGLGLADGSVERLSASTRGAEGRITLFASRSETAAGGLEGMRGGWNVQPVGSTAYKLAYVAAGRGEAFLSRGPKSEWDVCAGVLLVAEAGGRVTDIRGRLPGFNRSDPFVRGVIAANPALHEVLRRQKWQ